MMSAHNADLSDLVSQLVPIRNLAEQSQAQVLNTAEIQRFRRGEYVFKQGDRDSYAFFLIEGCLELLADGQTVQRVMGGTEQASCALAQLQPRKMSAKVESEAVVLRANRDLLDKLAAAGLNQVTLNSRISSEGSGLSLRNWKTESS